MKAIVINKFGGTEQLQLKEVAIPTPKSGELLVRIHAAGVNPVDAKIRNGSMKFVAGRKLPRILGCDFAGVVEQTGKNSSFRPGDRVYGMLDYSGGGYAEFLAVRETQVSLIPEGLSMEEAAAAPVAAITAYRAMLKGNGIKEGSKVLINGASGGVGTFAVQMAKAMGAHVTAVCSEKNTAFVKKLGADLVVDYTSEDFTLSTNTYDMVFDAVAKNSFAKCRKILNEKGTYVSTLPNNGLFFYQALNFLRKKKAAFIMAKASGNDLEIIADYIKKGAVKVMVEQTFPLEQAAKAHELIETERVKGKLVLTVIA